MPKPGSTPLTPLVLRFPSRSVNSRLTPLSLQGCLSLGAPGALLTRPFEFLWLFSDLRALAILSLTATSYLMPGALPELK